MEALARDPLIPTIPPGQDELPYDDGEPMESPRHRAQMNLLIETLERHFHDRPDVYIGGNMALYYSELQARNQDFRAPDFFVVTNAIEDRERKSWVVWQEDGRTPDVVIELLSASTEREDRGRKMQIYAGLKVSEYYLFDPDTLLLEGYRLVGPAYARILPRADGDLDCHMVGLRLGLGDAEYVGLDGRWLRWRLPDGTTLPLDREVAAAEKAHAEQEKARADAESARADAESARANAESARARALEERLRALGIDPSA